MRPNNHADDRRHIGGVVLIETQIKFQVLIGAAYIFFGGYLLFHPVIGVTSLTLLLAILFLVEGVFSIILWWKMRSAQGATWVLIDALVTLALGAMIYYHWPSSSVWAIGTLLGVSMIMSGMSRIIRLDKEAAKFSLHPVPVVTGSLQDDDG